jgi:hypothetical protein
MMHCRYWQQREGHRKGWRSLAGDDQLITDTGVLPVEHDVEELCEIQEIVERGPDWNTIESIVIRLARRAYNTTIEEAAEL